MYNGGVLFLTTYRRRRADRSNWPNQPNYRPTELTNWQNEWQIEIMTERMTYPA